jgi:RimJ/RimL family protein N-acetyltransferase
MEVKFTKIDKSHVNELADWLSSDTWPYFLGNAPTKEEVLKRIEDGAFFGDGELNFWILNEQEKPIGLIELYQLDDLAPMFSVRLKTNFRQKGLGQPILNWITRYIFENYPDKRRIEGQTREDNVAMRKLFNKCGYIKEAYYRMASPTENGERVASIAYGILREDWLSGKTTSVKWKSDSFFDGDKS